MCIHLKSNLGAQGFTVFGPRVLSRIEHMLKYLCGKALMAQAGFKAQTLGLQGVCTSHWAEGTGLTTSQSTDTRTISSHV